MSLPRVAAREAVDVPHESSFALPAQPLDKALDAFGAIARVSVAYEQGVAALRSTAVRGRYTPQLALSLILGGTGLEARFTGPRQVIVFRREATAVTTTSRPAPTAGQTLQLDLGVVKAPLVLGRGSRLLHEAYARRMMPRILDLVRNDAAFTGKPLPRFRLAVAIDISGRITRAHIVGHAPLEQRLDWVPQALVGARLPEPPPADLEQPLRFDLAAGIARQGR